MRLLDDQDIHEFIQIYEGEFGETLAPGDARALATSLMGLYELLAKPLAGERYLHANRGVVFVAPCLAKHYQIN